MHSQQQATIAFLKLIDKVESLTEEAASGADVEDPDFDGTAHLARTVAVMPQSASRLIQVVR
jgi:hypothetical protein